MANPDLICRFCNAGVPHLHGKRYTTKEAGILDYPQDATFIRAGEETGGLPPPSWRTQGDGYYENKSLPHDTFNEIPESNTVDEEYSQNNNKR